MTQKSQLAYHVHPGNGPHLALLHGFLSSSAQWQLNLEALGAVCTPVTIELWGHGNSPAPQAADFYTPAAYLEQLDLIRRALGCEKWFLCGYSLGAGITIRYSHEKPQHVYAHIFTNSQSAFADAQTLATWHEDLPTAAAKIRAAGQPAIRRIAVHPRFAKRLPESIYSALNKDAEKLSPIAVANTLEFTNLNVSIRDIAAQNERPALLCFGKHERRFSRAKEWAATNMAALKVVDLDAGHGVNMEDAAGFNQHTIEFLKQYA